MRRAVDDRSGSRRDYRLRQHVARQSNFAGFASTKAAQRALAESIARELKPKDIHFAYIIIDAVIGLDPQAASRRAWQVAHQPRFA
jgi:NAD(P)-dependent dehydrogenase (short-subunit alcohol dehydrogenase family)